MTREALLEQIDKSHADDVRVRLTAWAMGRPPGEVLTVRPGVAEILLKRNVAVRVEEESVEKAIHRPERNKAIPMPPRAK